MAGERGKIRPQIRAYLDIDYRGRDGYTTYCCTIAMPDSRVDTYSLAEVRYLRDMLTAIEAEVVALRAQAKVSGQAPPYERIC